MKTALMLVVLSSLAIACGGDKKPAKDPSSDSSGSSDGSKDGATSDDQKTSSGASSGSSGSSGDTSNSGANGSGNSGGSSVAPVEGGGHRGDQYDKDATEVVLKRAARQVKANCGSATDDSGKAPGPFGKVTVNVTLGHNGHSKTITVPAPFDGTPPGKCIMQAFSNLMFPPWAGSDTPVDWEVEVVKPAK